MVNSRDRSGVLLSFYKLSVFYTAGVMVLMWWVLNTPLHFDHALLLELSGLLMSGKEYYSDFIDISPPLHIAYYYPSYLLHNIAGLSVELSLKLYFVAFVTLSMLLVNNVAVRAKARYLTIYVALALSLLFIGNPRYIMVKDVMSILLMLPWLLCFVSNVRSSAVVSTIAGIGMVAKPHFLLLWGAVTVWELYRRKTLRHTVIDTLPFVLVGITYSLVTLLMFPSFYESILGLLALYDSEKGMPMLLYVAFGEVGLLIIALSIPFYTFKKKDTHARYWLLIVTFLVIGLLQGVGLHYHFFGAWIVGCIYFAHVSCEMGKNKALSAVMLAMFVAINLVVSFFVIKKDLALRELYEGVKSEIPVSQGYWTRLSCERSLLGVIAYRDNLKLTPLIHSPWIICPYFSKPSDDKAELFLNLILKSYERGQLNYIFSIKNEEGYDNPYAKVVVSELERLGFIGSSKVLDADESNVEILYLK